MLQSGIVVILDATEEHFSVLDGDIWFPYRLAYFLDCSLLHIRGDTTAFVVIAISYAQHKFEFRL